MNIGVKLQLEKGNLIYVQNCLRFGLDEFLYLNFQIFCGNWEKSNLAHLWDTLTRAYIREKKIK
jgi:hypothetical protein